jgi:hypothetical protein
MIVKLHESNYKIIKSGKKINEKKSIKKSWQGDEHIKWLHTPSDIRRCVGGANNFYNLILIYIY